MRVRRYYGFDCNSWDGFNNGRYIDADYIDVDSIDAAEELCRAFLRSEYGDDVEIIEMDSGDAFQVITGYYDEDGNDLTKSQYEKRCMDNKEASYRYVYVSYYFEDEGMPE